MKSRNRNFKINSEITVTIRNRNQITLPASVLEKLGLGEGDSIVLQLGEHAVTLRPVRNSYAGVLKGVYGDPGSYIAGERDWE